MSVKLKIAVPGGIYFITITCFKWLPLFNIADSYDPVYKWFQYLKRTFPVDYGYMSSGLIPTAENIPEILPFDFID
jgi:hypothetical protein